MSDKTSKTIRIFALALVLLIPLSLMAKAMVDRTNGSIWQVSISGYDPRDLLRGHYLMFTYDWRITGDQKECSYGQKCCLCLNESKPGDRVDPDAKIVACGSPEERQCTAVIHGKKGWNGVIQPNQQYFVPEDQALALEQLLREGKQDFKMEIAVPHRGGPAMIRELFIDDLPLGDYILKKLGQDFPKEEVHQN